MNRLDDRFAALKAEDRAAFVAYVMAGDPDLARSAAILKSLPAAGADVIELGFPFSDPMAEGPVIQVASQRALAAGTTLRRTLEMVAEFRGAPFPLQGGRAGDGGGNAARSPNREGGASLPSENLRPSFDTPIPGPSPLEGEGRDQSTPIVLMGYLNPLLSYGYARFAADASAAGVDGLIVVDCPPEEADELSDALEAHAIALIRLTAPTTDDARLAVIAKRTAGFVYYVSVAGVTGVKEADAAAAAPAVARIRKATGLPVAVGFGIKTPERAAEVARIADAAVVGSALVEVIAKAGETGQDPVSGVLSLVTDLSRAVRGARTRQEA